MRHVIQKYRNYLEKIIIDIQRKKVAFGAHEEFVNCAKGIVGWNCKQTDARGCARRRARDALVSPWQSGISDFRCTRCATIYVYAQPLHKVKANPDERSGELARNVYLKGWLSCVQVSESSRDGWSDSFSLSIFSLLWLFLFFFFTCLPLNLSKSSVSLPLLSVSFLSHVTALIPSRAVCLFLIPRFYFFFPNISSLLSFHHCRAPSCYF